MEERERGKDKLGSYKEKKDKRGRKGLRAEGEKACMSEVIGLVEARHGRSRPRAPRPSDAACHSPPL